MPTFSKALSSNDLGKTGGHQAGIVIPKSDGDLLALLPPLDASTLNPSTWIECITPDGVVIKLRYVYYNNRLHVTNGTRNEYRLTHLTKFLRETGASEGDRFEISGEEGSKRYRIRVLTGEDQKIAPSDYAPSKIKLRTGWRRVH
mgnify:CR=1 FL=1